MTRPLPHQLALPVHGRFPERNPAASLGQRWRHGRHSWARRSEPGGFRAELYSVRPIDEASAKDYVLRHHYAKSYPAAVHRLGLYFEADPASPVLVGVAVFAVPMNPATLTNVLPELEPGRSSLELSRFVLEGGVLADGAPGGRAPANSESWFLKRALRHVRKHGVRAVVAFSDPVPRRLGDQLLWPGHYGTIYQASNAVFTGRGTKRLLTVLPDGTALADRTASKIIHQEPGHAYAERRLIALGACPRIGGAGNARAWLTEALEEIGALRLRHPGNFRFVLPATPADRRTLHIRALSLPYPKAALD